jgi:tetratricopeptide (TPR) repeat protein
MAMEPQVHKYERTREFNDRQWLEKLWYLYSQKLCILNLQAERKKERDLLEVMAWLLKSMARDDHRMDLLMMQARHYSDIGDLNRAEETVEQLLASITPDTGRDLIRQAYEWRALIAREKTQTRRALQYYQEAEKHADSDLDRAGIWLDKGLTMVYGNQLQPAEKLLRQAIAVYERFNSADILGDAYNNLGICLINQEKVPEALAAYSQAIRYYDRSGYKLGSAIVSGNISEIYWYHGDYDRALRSAYDCQRLGTEAQDQISVGLSYEMLGRLHMDLGSFERGAEFLKESIRAVEQVDDRAVLALNNSYLAQCYSRMGDSGKAREHFEASLAINRELDDPELTARLDLAGIHIGRLSRPGGPVLRMIEEYTAKYRQHLRKNDVCKLLYEKAVLLSETGRQDEAEKAYAELLAGIPPTIHKSFILSVQILGHLIFKRLGNSDRASEHRHRAQYLRDEIREHISDPDLRSCFMGKKEVGLIDERE